MMSRLLFRGAGARILLYVSLAGFMAWPYRSRGDDELSKKSDLQSRVEKFLKLKGMDRDHLSLNLFKNGVEVLDINAQTKKIPASVTKLFTALAVLKNIPPGTKFNTRLLSSGKIGGKKLNGPIYLVGQGDSGFVSETMWYLVNAFYRTGVQSIEGNVIVDDTYFDSKRFDESREDHRVDRAYDAPVGAMSFNWNSVNIFLRPGQGGQDNAQAIVDPFNNYIELDSKLKVGAKTDYTVDRQTLNDGRDRIVVRGTINRKSAEIPVYKSISNPALWSGYNLLQFLKEKGIEVRGNVQLGKAPLGIEVLAEAPSKPIESLLADMNKFSNNFVAEMLTKQLVALTGKQGQLNIGMDIIKQTALDAGLSSNEFELYNPSGLTRDNQFSSRALTKILEYIRKDFRIYPEFASSLPIAGVDGTLKNRMKNSSSLRWVRAKTGLLTGVTSLAGYIGLDNGEVLSFAFIYNGPKDGSRVRSFYDELISEIILDHT